MPCSCRKIVLPRRRAHVGVTKEMGEREAVAVGPRLPGTGPRRGGVQGQFGHIHRPHRVPTPGGRSHAASQRGYFRPTIWQAKRDAECAADKALAAWAPPLSSLRSLQVSADCPTTTRAKRFLRCGSGDEPSSSSPTSRPRGIGRENSDAPSTCVPDCTGRMLVSPITGVASLVGIPASCSLAALTCFRFFLSSCAHVVFFPLMGWGFRNRIYMAHKKIFRNPWRYQKCMIHSHAQLSVELELRQRDNNEAPLALHAADEMFHSWQLRAWPSCLQQVAARPGSRN